METKISALAILDAEIAEIESHFRVEAVKLREARAAVAELVEAVRASLEYGVEWRGAAVRDRIAAAIAKFA